MVFDNLVVVTHPRDLDTQQICNENGVKVVTTDAFNKDGAVFNKGAAINVGINALHKRD